jgi:hypothetical protein
MHFLDDAFDDRQAEAHGSFTRRRSGAQARELAEKPFLILLTQARAFIPTRTNVRSGK